MLRPLAVLSLGLGLLASPAAQAQRPPPAVDCLSNGMITLGAFTAQYVINERGVDTSITEYFVGLRATRQALGFVAIRIAPASGVQAPPMTEDLQFPVGQEVRVRLGRRSRLRTHCPSQKMTVAASAMALKKVRAQRS